MAVRIRWRGRHSSLLPEHVLADLWVGKQLFAGIVASSQFFFVGDQIVDRRMARLADLEPGLHLLAGVAAFEPLVRVQVRGIRWWKLCVSSAWHSSHNIASVSETWFGWPGLFSDSADTMGMPYYIIEPGLAQIKVWQ
jgi:hypothetical protein